jgi:hypothetical protein
MSTAFDNLKEYRAEQGDFRTLSPADLLPFREKLEQKLLERSVPEEIAHRLAHEANICIRIKNADNRGADFDVDGEMSEAIAKAMMQLAHKLLSLGVPEDDVVQKMVDQCRIRTILGAEPGDEDRMREEALREANEDFDQPCDKRRVLN